ncbi:hypothetical protein [Subdoligranulum variabile]|nr:hypothetical protein [Subdoligranulum variabile]
MQIPAKAGAGMTGGTRGRLFLYYTAAPRPMQENPGEGGCGNAM